jgi:hypothetical protein
MVFPKFENNCQLFFKVVIFYNPTIIHVHYFVGSYNYISKDVDIIKILVTVLKLKKR